MGFKPLCKSTGGIEVLAQSLFLSDIAKFYMSVYSEPSKVTKKTDFQFYLIYQFKEVKLEW